MGDVENNIAAAVQPAATLDFPQPVRLVLIGYSLGGGMVYDLSNDMFGHNAHPAVPTKMPANVALAGTVYIDAIDFADGHYIMSKIENLQNQDKGKKLIPAQGNRPVDTQHHFNYYESDNRRPTDQMQTPAEQLLRGIETVNDLPAGVPTTPFDGLKDLQYDVDKPEQYRMIAAAYGADLSSVSLAGSVTVPPNHFGHVTIDDDPLVIESIVRNVRTIALAGR